MLQNVGEVSVGHGLLPGLGLPVRDAICPLGDRDAFGDAADLCESHVRLSSEDVEGYPRFGGMTNRIPLRLPRM